MYSSPEKRAICFIPSGEMIRLKPISHWLQRFAEFTRRTASEASLPAVGFRGPFFDGSKVSSFPNTYRRTYLLPDWVKEARASLGEGAVVWGTIIVELGFLQNAALWLHNQYDDELGQVCMVNPVVQSILADLINEVIEVSQVDGIVLDVTDAYPNSYSDSYEGPLAHCFCNHCMEALALKGFGEPKEAFVGANGLLRLVLKSEEGGAAHIDPPQEWLDQRNASALTTLALARKFVLGEEEGSLESEALRLLAYFRARVETTAEAIRTILGVCKERERRSAVALGSDQADLSQLVTLEALDRAKSADEYWLPYADKKKTPGEWEAVQFLSGRSTYYFNAFFEGVEMARERLVLAGVEEFLQSLLHTSKRLMTNQLTPGATYAVGKLDQFSGFAGVPLGQEDHLEIVDRLTREVTGQVLPDELLQRFRIANPDKMV